MVLLVGVEFVDVLGVVLRFAGGFALFDGFRVWYYHFLVFSVRGASSVHTISQIIRSRVICCLCVCRCALIAWHGTPHGHQ